jgi:hypothetical protein
VNLNRAITKFWDRIETTSQIPVCQMSQCWYRVLNAPTSRIRYDNHFWNVISQFPSEFIIPSFKSNFKDWENAFYRKFFIWVWWTAVAGRPVGWLFTQPPNRRDWQARRLNRRA